MVQECTGLTVERRVQRYYRVCPGLQKCVGFVTGVQGQRGMELLNVPSWVMQSQILANSRGTCGGAVYATGNISGGHLNPAVTLGAMLTGYTSRDKGFAYIIAQIAGSVLAAVVQVSPL
jgi:hypothetical protein